VAAIERDLEAPTICSFALPLIDDLAALPAQARWGDWLERLAAGAARRPARRPRAAGGSAARAAVGQ
jgi:hypothetical protein